MQKFQVTVHLITEDERKDNEREICSVSCLLIPTDKETSF